MSILTSIPIIGDIIKGATSLISEAITDTDKKLQLESQLKKLQLTYENKILEMGHDEKIAQIEVNKEEAKSKSLFVSGWRPAIGWICGTAFGCNFVLYPLVTWLIPTLSIWYPEASKVQLPPAFDLSQMLPLMGGMLGIGTLRTVEKAKGVHNK